jgi:hypothetical protein
MLSLWNSGVTNKPLTQLGEQKRGLKGNLLLRLSTGFYECQVLNGGLLVDQTRKPALD